LAVRSPELEVDVDVDVEAGVEVVPDDPLDVFDRGSPQRVTSEVAPTPSF